MGVPANSSEKSQSPETLQREVGSALQLGFFETISGPPISRKLGLHFNPDPFLGLSPWLGPPDLRG